MEDRDFFEKKTPLIDVSTLSDRVYNMTIGGTITWGMILNIIMYHYFAQDILKLHILSVIVIYLIGSFTCIHIVDVAENPVVGFLGFSGLSLSMGLLLTYCIVHYDIADIQKAFIMTAAITLFMTALSGIFPNFFIGLGRILFTVLIAFIVVEIIMLFMGMAPAIMDYICVGLFCLYVGYDWAVAQDSSHTPLNAIESAAKIYIDMANIFIRILSIISKKK